MTVRRVDIHQHLWPDGLLSSLARRTAPPSPAPDGARLAAGARRRRAGAVRPALRTTRATRARRRRLQRILIAPSSPLGIESLAASEAEALLDDFHAGVLELGAPFELWAGLVLADPPARVDALLDAGAVGLSLPAGALGGPAGIERLGPALERLAQRGAPLFVHPGPAAGVARVVSGADVLRRRDDEAWHAWARGGGRRTRRCGSSSRCSPGSRRCTPSGWPPAAARPTRCTTASRFFDTSSYGPRAIDAMLRVVGVDRLLYGSDRPVVEPVAARGARRRGRARPRPSPTRSASL